MKTARRNRKPTSHALSVAPPAPAPVPAIVHGAQKEADLRSQELEAEAVYSLLSSGRRAERIVELRVRAHQEFELESARADAARARAGQIAELIDRLEGSAQ